MLGGCVAQLRLGKRWHKHGGQSAKKGGDGMKVMKKASSEKDFLAPVMRSASASEIRDGLIAKAQCCVDHLCGCKK